MRKSRIPHPPGDRFIQVNRWAVQMVGRSAATVLAALDFIDQVQDEPGRPLATRQQLVAELEGFVGRNAVDQALDLLVGLGWISKVERKKMGDTNLQRWFEYCLRVDAIALHLSGNAGVPKPGCRESPKRDQNRDQNRDAEYRREIKPEPPPEEGAGGGVSAEAEKNKTPRSVAADGGVEEGDAEESVQTIISFLQAAGNPEELAPLAPGGGREKDLEARLKGATTEAAQVAGRVLGAALGAGTVKDAVAYCLALAQRARDGTLIEPATNQHTAAVKELEEARRCLAGRHFRNSQGMQLEVDQDAKFAKPPGANGPLWLVDMVFVQAVREGRLVEIFAA